MGVFQQPAKGRSLPAWYFLYIVPPVVGSNRLDPALKAGIAGYSPFSKPLHCCPRTLEIGIVAADFIELFALYLLLSKPRLPRSRRER